MAVRANLSPFTPSLTPSLTRKFTVNQNIANNVREVRLFFTKQIRLTGLFNTAPYPHKTNVRQRKSVKISPISLISVTTHQLLKPLSFCCSVKKNTPPCSCVKGACLYVKLTYFTTFRPCWM